MRQLSPKVVEQRKKDLLQWIIHYYIKTSRPVASSVIAKESGLKLSSATIRNVLQELEDEGFLHQVHSSSGREPTDKGYRFFVDYLLGAQRLASDEKEKIENHYRDRIAELDTFLSETSKLLSKVSREAGLVFAPKANNHVLRRLELIGLGGCHLLCILVTEEGMVRHWPIRVGFNATARQVNVLNRFLNEHAKGRSIEQAQSLVVAQLRQLEQEFRELTGLVSQILAEVGSVAGPAESMLYVTGADNILSHAEELGDIQSVQSLLRVLDEKRMLAGLLEDELSGEAGGARRTSVRIGRENNLPELSGLSLVTTTYKHNDRVVGVLGILGSKRMHYSRMMSLLDYMSEMISERLKSWNDEEL